MGAQYNAEALNVHFTAQPAGYLNLCVKSRNQLFTSGHVSDLKGKLGADLTTVQGYEAARNCAVKVLNSVWNRHGSLDGLRLVRVQGCVNSTPDFIEQHLVINGASDLFHAIFGTVTLCDPHGEAACDPIGEAAEPDGYHARSALGFVSLPTGAAVELEAIFEIKRKLDKERS